MSETFFCYIRDIGGFKFIVAFIITHIIIMQLQGTIIKETLLVIKDLGI